MTDIPRELTSLEAAAQAALEAAADATALEQVRVRYLGRKGSLAAVLRSVADLDPAERPAVGKLANEAKQRLETALALRREALEAAARAAALAAERADVTLPGRPIPMGRLHPSTQILRRICQIWADMGFQIYRSRDVETEAMNFELLNIPAHHPARDMWDTFYTTVDGVLLRTHTSPGQIRAMREYCPEPIRVILPGMCYRYEQITARSEIQFHQVEGLAVGRHVTMTELKGTLVSFAHRMFGAGRRVRFRASHFPFTEPSAEMDVKCILCGGTGCFLCKQTGWLEILGCGMVHPAVLQNGGYDPAVFSGFAFGMGPERITMLRHGIEDIRYFWANDLRFLEQF
ncbi:MAG: phenylalanine--tRNA ligase subunit alpha [candidate division NC10 bacterium]|nr:phenylalanine--tRNA ligase subunit alpha [candidate division NC10 bacterium]